MPFRASAPFLPYTEELIKVLEEEGINALSGWCSISTTRKYMSALTWGKYQCPFGLVLHFYYQDFDREVLVVGCINALSGWDSISTRLSIWQEFKPKKVSMPFRANAPFLQGTISESGSGCYWVSMPFRADALFLRSIIILVIYTFTFLYQCPFGLMLYFYVGRVQGCV